MTRIVHYSAKWYSAVAKAKKVAAMTGRTQLVLTSCYGVDVVDAAFFSGAMISGCYVDRVTVDGKVMAR